MMFIFPRRCSPHRRRAAWSMWWDAQRRLHADRRFLRSPAFDPMEDDWLRLTERGLLIGATGFCTPQGMGNEGPWPMHGGYFEKPGLWIRGAQPFDWIGHGRRQRPRLNMQPMLVGLALSPLSDMDGDLQDRRLDGSRLEVLSPWALPGTPHRFNPEGTTTTVQMVLERPRCHRLWDDHPVIHVFGPSWWTREQVEGVMEQAMDVVRQRLPDGQWLDPDRLRHAAELTHGNTRAELRHRVSDLIDFRDFRSNAEQPLPSEGDRRFLLNAGGQRLLDATVAQWRSLWPS